MAQTSVSPEVVSQILIKVGGKTLAHDDPALTQLLEVTVDQHAHLPSMFTIRLRDRDLKLLDEGPFDLAEAIEISSLGKDGRPILLIKGEVTALEPEFAEGMVAQLVVRGYDRLHRLYCEVKSKTYLNIKDSDLAERIANAIKLTPDVETTKTVYAHIYQHNQSDLAFLMERAWRIGYECFVDDNKLIFRRPTTNGPQSTLTWGTDLLTFQPRITLAEQVEEVMVRGWDAQKKAAIVGRAQKGNLYPEIKDKESTNNTQWSQKFNGKSKMTIVDQPVVSQAEADILATARLDELSGVFIEAEGSAFRRPDLRAGQRVRLEALGKRFSGVYLITSATHVYSADGFRTNFSVRGARTGLLLDQMLQQAPMTRWPGVVQAIVTNTDDPNSWGRVKVKFPWLLDSEESAWARVVSAGAGPTAGFCTTPAVDDEVFVAFVHGDFNQPIVLGGVWNGQDALPPPVAGAAEGEKPLVRTWRSRTGHQLTMYDNQDKRVELKTAQGHHMNLDDAQKRVEVVTQGGHNLSLDDKENKITLTSTNGLSITLDDRTNEITINASANITLKAGATLAIEASTLSLSASSLTLKGDGNIELTTGGQVSIKGAMINLN